MNSVTGTTSSSRALALSKCWYWPTQYEADARRQRRLVRDHQLGGGDVVGMPMPAASMVTRPTIWPPSVPIITGPVVKAYVGDLGEVDLRRRRGVATRHALDGLGIVAEIVAA